MPGAYSGRIFSGEKKVFAVPCTLYGNTLPVQGCKSIENLSDNSYIGAEIRTVGSVAAVRMIAVHVKSVSDMYFVIQIINLRENRNVLFFRQQLQSERVLSAVNVYFAGFSFGNTETAVITAVFSLLFFSVDKKITAV